METSFFTKESCDYAGCYCEENVYKLCEKFIKSQKSSEQEKGYAVFLTNPQKQTYILYQQIGNPLNNNLVIWDYHVIFITKAKTSSFVYDLDSTLDFPIKFNEYYKKALGFSMKRRNRTFYRVCECEGFLKEFASDRSHMLIDKEKGIYNNPIPKWPCIGMKETMNLEKYLDLGVDERRFGKVMNEDEFYDFFMNS